MSKNSDQFLGTERIGNLMKQYAIPSIISLLVGALYSIVDQIFIANASYLGSYGNVANTVVFPLTVIALAIAVMIGDGCCAFVSLSLGKNEPDKAKKSVHPATEREICFMKKNYIPKFDVDGLNAMSNVEVVTDEVFEEKVNIESTKVDIRNNLLFFSKRISEKQ